MAQETTSAPLPDETPRKEKKKFPHVKRKRTLSSESYPHPTLWYLIRWHDGRIIRQRGFASRANAERFLERVAPKLSKYVQFENMSIISAKFSDCLTAVKLPDSKKVISCGPNTFRYKVRWKNRRTGKSRGFDSEEDARKYHRNVWEFERNGTGFFLYPTIYMRLT